MKFNLSFLFLCMLFVSQIIPAGTGKKEVKHSGPLIKNLEELNTTFRDNLARLKIYQQKNNFAQQANVLQDLILLIEGLKSNAKNIFNQSAADLRKVKGEITGATGLTFADLANLKSFQAALKTMEDNYVASLTAAIQRHKAESAAKK